jgi:hypothetical protein
MLEPPEEDPRLEFQALYQALATDSARNQLICRDVFGTVREGRKPLLLTERTEHLGTLAGSARGTSTPSHTSRRTLAA